MDKLVIEGGRPLQGSIEASGAKNAVLPLMSATLLTRDEFHFTNVPDLKDVHTMAKLLSRLGADVSFEDDELAIDTRELDSNHAPYDLVKKMRASVLTLGPLLSHFGEARVARPGGCAIGTRPIDMHLSGFEELGAEVEIEHGDVIAKGELQSGEIYLDFPSVGATENLIMAAALAEGKTVIENAAREPEINCLGKLINKMGGDVRGAGEDRIIIEGVSELTGAKHRVIPDRIETGTYLVAGAITGGKVTVREARPRTLQSVVKKLTEAGMQVDTENNDQIKINAHNGSPDAVDIVTMPYPGFPTDMQAQFMSLMTLTEGTSTIKETIFENRFMHVLELERFGADIKIDGNTVSVRGVDQLSGAPVMATDLRASAALILAGLAAKGTTDVRRIYHLDRGYEELENKLQKLGARINREQGGLP